MEHALAVALVENAILECLYTNPSDYNLNTPVSDMKADSLDVVNVMVCIEGKLDDRFTFGGVDLSTIKTVGNLVEIVEKW